MNCPHCGKDTENLTPQQMQERIKALEREVERLKAPNLSVPIWIIPSVFEPHPIWREPHYTVTYGDNTEPFAGTNTCGPCEITFSGARN